METLEALVAKQEQLTTAAAEIKARYPYGLPTAQELARAKKETDTVNTIRQLKTRYVFPDSKIDKLQRYERVYGHTMPEGGEYKKRTAFAVRFRNSALALSPSGKRGKVLVKFTH